MLIELQSNIHPYNLAKEGCQLVVLCGAMPSLWALCGLGLHKMSCHMGQPPTYNCPYAMSQADCTHALVT